MRPFLFFLGLPCLRRRWVAAALLLVPASFTLAQSATFSSGPRRTDLLELYTSEGCSSCPPAEDWLAGRREDRGLWREFVPVAFHVNYWDRLGWRDRFAVAAYTDRQRAYSAAWGARTIYTPGFVRAGSEWRPGTPAPAAAAGGRLSVDLAGSRVTVRYQPLGPGRYQAFVALLGGGLQSEVKRGENAGRRLHHEFLVLGLNQGELSGASEGSEPTHILSVDLPTTQENPARRAVAVWITRAEGILPLQAAGGWLPE